MSEDAVTPAPALPARPAEPANISMTTGLPVDAEPPVSPRLSFKGWRPETWLAKNASFVKKTLTGACTATGGIAVTDLASLRAVAVVWGLAAAALLLSAGFDAIHYFLVEQKEPRG